MDWLQRGHISALPRWRLSWRVSELNTRAFKSWSSEHAQVTSHSRLPSTVSPFVPTSRNRVSLSVSSMWQASTPALMSDPT